MTMTMGFIITHLNSRDYTESKNPKKGAWNTSFFRAMAVKSIGETHHSPANSRSAELAAAWGQSGKFQEVKA